MTRAVFLDRDGVIIRTDVRDGKPFAITSLDELVILDGAADAIQRLKDAGFMTVVVSNQPDVARGKLTRATVEAINAKLMEELALDEVRVCYDVDASGYKPGPGMLLDAASEHGIDLSRSTMIGDRWRDVGAGKRAGCFTVFIDCGYDEPLTEKPDAVARSLPDAVDLVLAQENPSKGGP